MESPYNVGNELKLRMQPSGQALRVSIEHLYTPVTMSVVLRVLVMEEPPSAISGVRAGDSVVLKLYDRRYSPDLRAKFRLPPYTSDSESLYVEDLVTNPPKDASTLTNAGDYDDDEDNDEEDEAEDLYDGKTLAEYLLEMDLQARQKNKAGGNTGSDELCATGQTSHNEDDLQDTTLEDALEHEHEAQEYCLQLAKSEKQVYVRLEPMQHHGKIPRHFADVELVFDTPPSFRLAVIFEDTDMLQEYLTVKGALLEFVDNTRTMRNMAEFIPEHDWRSVILQATTIVNEWGDYDVLNRDVAVDNMLIQVPPKLNGGDSTSQYRVIAIDFAQAQLKGDNQVEEDWKREKYQYDEEGAIAVVMHHRLGIEKWKQPGPGTSRYRGPWAWDE